MWQAPERMASSPSVSVVIPAHDGGHLGAALDSVLAQRYGGAIEVIVADGAEPPRLATKLERSYPDVRVVRNPEGSASAGLNHALAAATGEVVVRCDAHAVLPPDYVARAVDALQRTGAANVGGQRRAVGTGFFERAAALAVTTLLGVGNARHHRGGREGPADTVYLGTWRRETLDAVGGFNPHLLRNQDYELNWRLREMGGTVWFDPALVVEYRPRGSLRGLAKQYFDYGRWKAAMLRQHPRSLRWRQLAAPTLVVGLLASSAAALLGHHMALLFPLVYLCALAAWSIAIGLVRREPAALLLPLALATMHLCWGVGALTPKPPPHPRAASPQPSRGAGFKEAPKAEGH